MALTLWLISIDFFGKLPSTEELENPKSNLATEIYSSDQQLLGTYFIRENRSAVSYEELSPHLTKALVATEDERYRQHSGIDLRGLARAVSRGGSSGGASTITQQLAKMLFHKRDRGNILKTIFQKLKEWVIAARLERQYTKEEIIAMYLNRFDFINNAVGIKTAARVYFGTSTDSLALHEAAMLVGMAKNPALFNPIRRPDTVQHRRNVVFAQMMRNELLTREEFDSLKVLPLGLNYQRVDHKLGLAPYFREVLRGELTRMFKEKGPDGKYKIRKSGDKPYNIYKDGLRIYTTIDSRMQAYGEWAVQRHLKGELQPQFFRNVNSSRNPNAPFSRGVKKQEVDRIMETARKRTSRYRVLTGRECGKCGRRGRHVKHEEVDGVTWYQCTADDCGLRKRGVPSDSIGIIFDQPVNMRVFTWKGEVDTVLSPNDSIRYYKSFLQAGMMSMDPHTGFVKAWVGGINFAHFNYDHVRQGRRQVGSTFKPFVYATAFQNNPQLTPCYEIPNHEYIVHKGTWGQMKDWKPRNTGYNFEGMVSLKFGLANSMNNVTAWLMKQLTPEKVIQTADSLGIDKKYLPPVASLCLGVADISLYEMVAANATFANKGRYIEPVFISHIVDKDGRTVYESTIKTKDVFDEKLSYLMLDLMKGVADGVYNEHHYEETRQRRPGTAIRIRMDRQDRDYDGISYPIAGKTGTTQNHGDGWFMGLTPDLVTGVWVGAENPSVRSPSIHRWSAKSHAT
ncbi:MAG: transglycosylase domain-containing protein [Bacteroidota bacterium]